LIFQPSNATWGSASDLADEMQEVWIPFASKVTGEAAKLDGLWAASEGREGTGPVLLYLHGARWNVQSSAPRMRRMQDLGFSVLAIDYRGFGKSSPGLPSEETAYEDAYAAWRWLAAKYPDRPRYIFGHSLGGAVAIDLASKVDDERGTIVEGTFTSIADVASTMKWGWLPLGPLITQRFESVRKVAKVGAPLLIVHGDSDKLIQSELGRKLYEAAPGKKRFLLVEGGSHHSTMAVGLAQYRQALADLFSLR
jgi:alpha-beta hydrolase superfamily lysophospholipase